LAIGKSRIPLAALPLVFAVCVPGLSTGAGSAGTPSSEAAPASDTAHTAAVAKAAPESKGPLAPGLYAAIFTAKGKITTQLEPEKAPLTVINFVALAEGAKSTNKPAGTRFYDGLTFHRVVPNFMIQGGDPDGNGSGGPGYQFADEFDPSLRFDRPGILAMANAGPGTNGSQFFITHVPTPHLNDHHTIFGHVVEGQDVVNAVVVGTVIDSIRIIREGAKAKKFKADEAAFQALEKKTAALNEAKKKKAVAGDEALRKKAIKTPSGLMYVVTRPGAGPKPAPGAKVKVHYAGRLTDGTEFDNSYTRGQPIEIQIGSGMVIPGWDEGIMMMQKGEKRTLFIPGELGYGPQGYPPRIPPNATLVFDVELVDFQ
jgi:FKBP-type peptidyl-prolyl cis-trans isomerase